MYFSFKVSNSFENIDKSVSGAISIIIENLNIASTIKIYGDRSFFL